MKLITDIGDVNITRGYRDGPAIAIARDQGGAQVIDQRIEECRSMATTVAWDRR
ncbi:MAG TPA: hypothetical protein VLL82_15685 [Mycobacterium sp.]|nr:hypothetical protein [Mycobacterium sp.]